mmetsp:Transcript_61584/g.163815  ORF Transcript_61584/g.163815 Transcript_61584/m.163815 type:complete len:205 (-) Transcript_61584:2199-2813(-)
MRKSPSLSTVAQPIADSGASNRSVAPRHREVCNVTSETLVVTGMRARRWARRVGESCDPEDGGGDPRPALHRRTTGGSATRGGSADSRACTAHQQNGEAFEQSRKSGTSQGRTRWSSVAQEGYAAPLQAARACGVEAGQFTSALPLTSRAAGVSGLAWESDLSHGRENETSICGRSTRVSFPHRATPSDQAGETAQREESILGT